MDVESGDMVVAPPPSGVPVTAVLAAALSRMLAFPAPLPLEPLLTALAEQLPAIAAALAPGGSSAGPGELWPQHKHAQLSMFGPHHHDSRN